MPPERLQKVLAAAGVASRRASEALIAEGRVRVDGRVARIGDSVDPATASIEVDGQPIGIGAVRAYLAPHKPAGVTSTVRDRHAAATVLDLVPTALVPDGTRLYPVGRLDRDSEGLLLLTNDGAWAERVLHPRFGVEREYAVGLRAELAPDQMAEIGRGIALDEGLARFTEPVTRLGRMSLERLAAVLEPSADPAIVWYRATLAQGWKRQIRRMLAAVGAPVERLVRVRIGAVRLDDLRCGRVRRLKAPEIRALTEEPGGGASRAGGGASRTTRAPRDRGDYPRRDGRARPGGGGRRAP